MGSPYLNSGEVIVLTTNRVSADAVTYDVMLTTERIFLIDNRNERFEPQIIPLSAILSVQGGKTPAHDPAITLLFRPAKETDTRQPLNLVFFQNPPENRKHERDEWIRNIIQLSINQHEKEPVPEAPVIQKAHGETGLRPSVRHGVAPEMVRPLSNVVDHWRPVTPVTVVPDEVEGIGEIPARAPALKPEKLAALTSDQGTEGYATGTTPVRELQPRRTDSPAARVVMPQIIEEALPAPAGTAPPDEQKELAPPYDTGVRDYSLQVPVRSLAVAQKPVPGPRQDTKPVPAPVVPVAEPGPEQEPDLPSSTASRPPDTMKTTGELIRVRESLTELEMPAVPADENGSEQVPPALLLDNEPLAVTGITEELQPETAGIVTPAGQEEPGLLEDTEAQGRSRQTAVLSVPVSDEQVPEPMPAGPSVEPATVSAAATGPEHATPVPPPTDSRPREMAEILSALQSSTGEPPDREQPAPAMPVTAMEPVRKNLDAGIPENPDEPQITPAGTEKADKEPAGRQARQPAPPVRGNRPFRTTVLYAAILLLIVVLAAAGAVLLFPQGTGQTGTPSNPSPTAMTVTTSPPQTLLPATVPSSGVIPVSVPSAATRIATPFPSLSPSPDPLAGIWVRVNSTAYYVGRIGNAGAMQEISGSGDYLYKVSRNDRPVQVSVRKQDNSGALLAVTIYRDGTPIAVRSVTSPMGSVDLLIDPQTAQIPGLTADNNLP